MKNGSSTPVSRLAYRLSRPFFAYLCVEIGGKQVSRIVRGKGKFGGFKAVSSIGKFSIEYLIAYNPIFFNYILYRVIFH